MNLENLYNILEQEILNLKKLLNLSLNKQEILVKMDREGLEKLTVEEEKLILEVKKTELRRLKEMGKIYSEEKIDEVDPKIQKFIENMSSKLGENEKTFLTNCEKKIKELVSEITQSNSKNLFLINHSRDFITDTINQIIKLQKKKVLDKRV